MASMLKKISSSALKYVDDAKANLGIDQGEDIRSPRKARRSSIGDAGFDTYVFDNNVGHRITPEQKFASYERARVSACL